MGKVDYYKIAVRQFEQQILPPGYPATTVVELRLWVEIPPEHAQLPGLHHRGRGQTGRCGSSGSTTWSTRTATTCRTCCRRPDAALGQPAGRHERQRRCTGRQPAPYTGPVPDRHPPPRRARAPGQRRLTPRPGSCPRRTTSRPATPPAGTLLRSLQREFEQRWAPTGARLSGLPVSQRPARDHAVVPRPHAGHDARRTCMPGRRASTCCGAARRPSDGQPPGPAPAARRPARDAVLRDPHRHPGPLLQRGRLALLPGQPGVLRGLAGTAHRSRSSRRPATGTSDIAPIWNPEFFGNTMVVNGKTWPYPQRASRGATASAC